MDIVVISSSCFKGYVLKVGLMFNYKYFLIKILFIASVYGRILQLLG